MAEEVSRRRRRSLPRWSGWLLLVVEAVLLVAIVETGIPFRHDRRWICAYTGSHRYNTRWVFGVETAWRYEPSVLEQWMAKHEMSVVHDWKRTDVTGMSLLGRAISSGSSWRVPQILCLDDETLSRFVQTSSDADIRRFAKTLRTGDEMAQASAIETIKRRCAESP